MIMLVLPLFSVGGAAESAVFDYDDDTIVVFSTDDNGLITASGSIVNHGEIIDPLTEGIDDNGSILITATVSTTGSSLLLVVLQSLLQLILQKTLIYSL